jgi:hypothetical protein
MGGLIVQRALECQGRSLAAGAVLLASVPRRGAAGGALRLARREPLAMLRTLVTADMWPPVATRDRVRRRFFSPQTPDTVVESTFRQLQNESFVAFLSLILRPPLPSRVGIPVRVMAAETDEFFTHAEHRDLAAAYRTTLHVVPGGHDLMLDTTWELAADHVLAWAASLEAPRERPAADSRTYDRCRRPCRRSTRSRIARDAQSGLPVAGGEEDVARETPNDQRVWGELPPLEGRQIPPSE